MEYNFPHGFVLSEAALYAFVCQDVYPDVVSFAAAIPDHLKPLFLIPIQVQFQSASKHIASRLAKRRRLADGSVPTGNTDEADLFGTKTLVNDDNQPTVPSSEPGSIFQMDDADDLTKHQEYDYDQNVQVPSETTFNSDVFPEDSGFDYPYTPDAKVRKSSKNVPFVALLKLRVALKPEQLETHAPPKIRDNARACTVSLVSYDKKGRVFTFAVDCGNGAKQVQAKLSDIDQVSMSCNCPFWRWNGPEFHAKENSFMLGQPFGTAEAPNVRDPDRKFWMCKHAYAVLRRLDNFVQEVVDENWDKDEEDLLDTVDEEWDRLEGAAAVPLEEVEEEDIPIDIDWEEPEEEEAEEDAELEAEQSAEDDGSVDVDLSELDEPEREEPDYETPSGGPESEPPPVEEDYETPEDDAEELPEEDYELAEDEEPEPEEEPEEEDYETPDEEPKSKK